MVYIKTNKQTSQPLSYEAFQKQRAKSTTIIVYCTLGTDSRAAHGLSPAASLAPFRKEIGSSLPVGTTAQHPMPRQKGSRAAHLHAMPQPTDATKSICTDGEEKNVKFLHPPAHGKTLRATGCRPRPLGAKSIENGLGLKAKMKKLNLHRFLHLVKEIMHFPQSLMPAPQGLYYYLLFCLLK